MTSPAQVSPARVLVVGESLIDAVDTAHGEHAEYVGGSPANVAFGLGSLGHDVALATWFGQDARGARIAAACERHGVSVVAGSDGADHTSVAAATLDSSGAATYEFDLDWQVPAIDADEPIDHVHAGSIAAVLEPGAADVMALLGSRRDTATVSYDPNARPTIMGHAERAAEVVTSIIALADVVKMSDEDVEWLFPDRGIDGVVAGFGEHGPSLVVVTQGGEGARVGLPRRAQTGQVGAPSVQVIDTVGAGDSFMAGLISGLLDLRLLGADGARERLAEATLDDVRPAIDRALSTAARTVAVAGAHAPTRAELG